MSSRGRMRSGHRRSDLARARSRPPALIGVGVDGGPSGRDAVALASLLASATGGELMLIAVYEEPLLEGVIPAEVGWRSVKQQARAMLAETRDSLAPSARIVVEPDVFAWRALRRVVRRERRELLVVGSGRDAGEGRVSLGRSAQELLGRVECPLAIAPRGMAGRDTRRLERIGVGYDDEPEARAALELAATIALAARAELEVCAVIDDRTPVGAPDEDLVPVGETIVENQARGLRDRVRTAARTIGVAPRVETSCARAADALSAFGSGVDVLVIGSSRSGRAGRVSVRSTGDALVIAGGAPCPVLIVPRPVR
jgi:nucleotide-binding universal stress UspA family protein